MKSFTYTNLRKQTNLLFIKIFLILSHFLYFRVENACISESPYALYVFDVFDQDGLSFIRRQ